MVFDTLEDKMDFGKFKGLTWGEILIVHPYYLTWAVENLRGGYFYVTDKALDEIRLMFPGFEMNQSFYLNVEAQRCSYEEYMGKCGNEPDCELSCLLDEPDTYGHNSGSYAHDAIRYCEKETDTVIDRNPFAI